MSYDEQGRAETNSPAYGKFAHCKNCDDKDNPDDDDCNYCCAHQQSYEEYLEDKLEEEVEA